MKEQAPPKNNRQGSKIIDQYFNVVEQQPALTAAPGLAQADVISEKEKEALFGQFNGGFSDIDVWIKHEEFRLKFEEFKLKKDNEDSERKLREDNAKLAFKFSAVWAGFIAFIIFSHAVFPSFKLTETEFLTVIGTLTASILIYYLYVVKYLFYRGE